MKIDLRKLLSAKVDEMPFQGTVNLSDYSFLGDKPFKNLVNYSGRIVNKSDILHFEGKIETVYVTACGRCLKTLEIPVDVETEMVLLPDNGENEESEDVYLYEGDAIDPEEILVSEMTLNIDMVYLCKEDCKGLCQHCGGNLNEIQCNCDEKPIDARLAVLKTLLK